MHNRLMGTKVPHPLSTNFDEAEADSDEFPTPPAKRVKTKPAAKVNSNSVGRDKNSPAKRRPTSTRKQGQRHATGDEIPDSEEEDESGILENGEEGSGGPGLLGGTQLETTLPPVPSTDEEEAIGEYEAYKAGQTSSLPVEKLNVEGGENQEEQQDEDLLGTTRSRLESRSWIRGRSSIYVDAFNLALDTVLEEERHLFNEAELGLFEIWKALSYEAQYLYVRLFLRKTSKWFRVRDLQYYSDVADMEGAVRELQLERRLPTRTTTMTTTTTITTTSSAAAAATVDDAEVGVGIVYPGELEPPEELGLLGDRFAFAECSSEHITTLDEASSLLLLDELKSLAKEVKVGVTGKTKRELLHNFRRTSGKQTGLGFLKRTETEESNDASTDDIRSVHNDQEDESSSGTVTPTTHGTINNRDGHFTKKILDRTGLCIRLSLAPLKLFERVHLVFYRSTEWTEKSLTTLILAKISRRHFPEYLVSRSSTIFESRALLLEFEASLRTQFRVDNILEFNGTPRQAALDEVKQIFEAVYPRWKALVAEEQRKEDRGVYQSGEGAYLRRFNPGWVYTRIVHKALHVLGRFKEHEREHQLLCELLEQRLFHASKRGAWYQRKALLEEHYMYESDLTPNEKKSVEASKKHWKRVALRTCEQGLQDKECHVIYHYDLQKRIKKLEKQLHLPKREQHDFGHARLKKAVERDVVGIKIEKEDTTTTPPKLSRKNSVKTSSTSEGVVKPPPTLIHQPSTSSGGSALGSKTIWLDTLDTNLPVSVEAMCLSHYRHILGYKGYHSEGGILRTLFGLLFFDILFFNPYIPNVFQTAYQTCPLDLHTDTFFPARMPEILGRINQISNGEAAKIAREVWDEQYDRRTCIVGVQWDGFARDDLLELIECWDGNALGTVMLIMAQDYQGRGGGVPDLVLWKRYSSGSGLGSGAGGQGQAEDEEDNRGGVRGDVTTETGSGDFDGHGGRKGEILFVEVKSANDRLSDTQRLWISALLGAGVQVELCHAVAGEARRE
ncbi:hypothetical protein ABEF95_016983 [Exophiala dermatitidis]